MYSCKALKLKPDYGFPMFAVCWLMFVGNLDPLQFHPLSVAFLRPQFYPLFES